MVRAVIAAVFSLLLVGMQREALVHDVDHLRARIARGHDAVVQNVVVGDCAQCALLASGGVPVPSAPGAFAAVAFAASRPVVVVAFAPFAAARVPYSSRAPPLVL